MKRQFDFMRARYIAAAVSAALLLASIGTLVVKGINFGLDFTGGTLVEVSFPQAVDPETVRQHLEGGGYSAVVQSSGSERDLLIRVPPRDDQDQSRLADEVQELLHELEPGIDLRRAEFVGPAVGEELREQGGLAMVVALAAVLLYIMFRFAGKFAIGAVVALVHDVIITLGAFAVMQWTFDLPSLAAVLAVIGYSLNDTIVVYDRIRENFRLLRRRTPTQTINISLNQTLERTLMTSFTTLLVLWALLFLGGEQVHGFADALIVGIIVGTYSSIYVAANFLIAMGVSRDDLVLAEKDDRDAADEVP